MFGTLGASSGTGSGTSLPVNKTVEVEDEAGVIYTIKRLLGPLSTLSLISGTNGNLSLVNYNQISAASAIAEGVQQVAVVRESLLVAAIEYAITFVGVNDEGSQEPQPPAGYSFVTVLVGGQPDYVTTNNGADRVIVGN